MKQVCENDETVAVRAETLLLYVLKRIHFQEI
jgi:hypothetical protein